MTLRLAVDATGWETGRGDGRFVRNAVRRLVAHPADWTLVADAGAAGALPGAAAIAGVPLRRATGRASEARRPADLVRLSRAARAARPDGFLSPSLYTWFPVPGVPTVVGVHDANAVAFPKLVLPSRRARATWRAKQALALRSATRLFTVSRAARDEIATVLRLDPARIAVVPEAPDEAFAPRSRDAVAAQVAAMGLSAETGWFVFAAGLSPHKGLDTLVDAYASLRSGREDAPPLVIVGAHDDAYASAAEELRARVARLGLERSVLLPGFVSDEALACLYSGAAAAVVPSRGEGFGLPAVEAAACGTASVLSDIGPHRESLAEAALFVRPGDPVGLREALDRLLDDERLRRSLGERALAAAARFSWDETARRLYALLVEASATRTPSADER